VLFSLWYQNGKVEARAEPTIEDSVWQSVTPPDVLLAMTDDFCAILNLCA